MKTFKWIIALLAALAAAPGLAEDADAGAITGKVVNIYVRDANNLFIEAGLVRNKAGKQQWTEVRFAAPLADGRTSEMVRMPDTAIVERGDLVSARLVEKHDSLPGLIPAVNRMVALVAKHDTLAAQTFDAPKPAAGSVPPYVRSLQALR